MWGEHEIDYVLFMVVENKNKLTIQMNADEVDDVKWVSKDELVVMMEDPDLLFSPWFRIIVNKWVLGNDIINHANDGNANDNKKGWWDDLKVTMNTNAFVDVENIHRFDPPVEHMGGGGDAGPLFENGAGVGKDSDYTTELLGDAS